MDSIDWLKAPTAEQIVDDLLSGEVKDGTCGVIIEALRRLGQEQRADIAWLDAGAVHQTIDDQIRFGSRCGRAVVRATIDAHEQLMRPFSPREQEVFLRLQNELTSRGIELGEISGISRLRRVEEAITAACEGTTLSKSRVRDLILRKQLADKAVLAPAKAS